MGFSHTQTKEEVGIVQGKFNKQQLISLLKKLESIAFSGTVHLNLELEGKTEKTKESLTNCIMAFRSGELMYAVPCLPDIHSIIDFLEHKLQRQWIAPAVVFASRQLKDPHSTQELIERLIAMELFTWGEIEAIFYAQTVIRLEQIWNYGGSFRVDKSLSLELRSAWKISDLLLEIARRKDRWTAIKPVVASMQIVPRLSSNFDNENIPPSVKKHLTEWVDGKRSLCDIAQCLDKDPLQIAQSYAKWANAKWVNFEREEVNTMPLVLAIDDSAVVQQLIQRTLQSFCRVMVASNAVDGLSILYHHPVKLLLLDVMMPEIDGLEVCRTIRRMPQLADLPIIMLTGKDGFFDKMKGKIAGSNEYITKPFEAENLKQLVRQYLNLSKDGDLDRQTVMPKASSHTPTMPPSSFQEATTRIQYRQA
ncbi:MAG: response regulator [Pseudanabaenaceae cyanobacterium bins.39]|nr:response regulator [Pseudanabaenaceae cyanobacterium bins.39]